jgi:HlyD family secretion protein
MSKGSGIRRVVIPTLTVVLLILLGAGWWSNRRTASSAESGAEKRVRVRRGSFTNTLTVTGELSPVRALRISVPQFRERNSVPIQAMIPEGAVVKAGETIVQIDNATLIASLSTEQINLDKAENDLAKKRSEVDVQIKDLEMELATRKLDVEKTALKAEIDKSLLALRDWQDNQFNYQKAKKEFEKSQQKLELTRKASLEEIALAEIKCTQSKTKIKSIEDDLNALQLKAPAAGTIVYENSPMTWNRNENDPPRKFQVGDQIWPGQIVMSVVDLDEMEVRAFVSEVDGGRLRIGQRARITVDSHPGQELTGAVEAIPEVAEKLRRVSNVRVFVVRIKLDRAEPGIMKTGMSVRAEITLDDREGLVLPRNAVFEENNKFYVRRPERGKTEVKILQRNATAALIEGVNEGDEAMISSTTDIKSK